MKDCPYCGAKAVEMTTHGETIRRFMCTSPERHRFTEEFERFSVEKQAERLIILP